MDKTFVLFRARNIEILISHIICKRKSEKSPEQVLRTYYSYGRVRPMLQGPTGQPNTRPGQPISRWRVAPRRQHSSAGSRTEMGKNILCKLYPHLHLVYMYGQLTPVGLYGACEHTADGRGHVNELGQAEPIFSKGPLLGQCWIIEVQHVSSIHTMYASRSGRYSVQRILRFLPVWH